MNKRSKTRFVQDEFCADRVFYTEQPVIKQELIGGISNILNIEYKAYPYKMDIRGGAVDESKRNDDEKCCDRSTGCEN